MSGDDSHDYPEGLLQKPLSPSVECEVCLVVFSVTHETQGDVYARGDITRVGYLEDGTLAIEVIEDAWEETLTIPIDAIDHWAAECPRDWAREFPTRGNAKGLRFVLDHEITELADRCTPNPLNTSVTA